MVYGSDWRSRQERNHLFTAKIAAVRHIVWVHGITECRNRIAHLGVAVQQDSYTRNVPIECRTVPLQDWLRYTEHGT